MRAYKVQVCTHARIYKTIQRLKITKTLVYLLCVIQNIFV